MLELEHLLENLGIVILYYVSPHYLYFIFGLLVCDLSLRQRGLHAARTGPSLTWSSPEAHVGR
jgi:hypothetical protein